MLQFERQVGPFALRSGTPTYPIDYVLDGQQRITSIFGVSQTELVADANVPWSEIYFDLGADEEAQRTQFFALDAGQVDPRRHRPLWMRGEATMPDRKLMDLASVLDNISREERT